MADLEPRKADASLSAVSTRANKAVAALHATLSALAERAHGERPESLSGEALDRVWRKVRRQRSQVEASLSELTEAVEDALDLADAEAAIEEPGASIPWEEIKTVGNRRDVYR